MSSWSGVRRSSQKPSQPVEIYWHGQECIWEYNYLCICCLYCMVLGYNGWFWWRQIHYEGHWVGWVLKIETFLGPEMANCEASAIWALKSSKTLGWEGQGEGGSPYPPTRDQWFWQNFINSMCVIKFWKGNENLRSVYKKPFFEILSRLFYFWLFSALKKVHCPF